MGPYFCLYIREKSYVIMNLSAISKREENKWDYSIFYWKEERKYNCCFWGRRDTPKPNDSEDLVVIGLVRGTIHVGDEVIITNLGSDNDKPAKLSFPHLKTRIKVK